MKKPLSMILILLCVIFIFSGCGFMQGQKIQNRINEYADTMYMVLWGNEYKESKLLNNIAFSRNEFKEEYRDRIHKFIFITDGDTASVLDGDTVKKFKEAMDCGFTIYFYDYQKNAVENFIQKFGLEKITVSSGCNFLLMLKCDNGQIFSSVSFSDSNAEPFSIDTILMTVLERNTH